MCGCAERQQRLNEMRPGLGDLVAKLADPIKALWLRVLAWLR